MKTKGKKVKPRKAKPESKLAPSGTEGQSVERPKFAEGNQWWKMRSKHGRDRIFETPSDMWEAACEYFEWATSHPFKKAEAKTVNIGDFMSQVEVVELPVMRPFTIKGLCRYLGCNEKYFNDFMDSVRDKDDEMSRAFSEVITRIRDIVYEQKFSGAASGFFNANIIARDLGLKENIDANINDNRKTTADLFPTELNKEN